MKVEIRLANTKRLSLALWVYSRSQLCTMSAIWFNGKLVLWINGFEIVFAAAKFPEQMCKCLRANLFSKFFLDCAIKDFLHAKAKPNLRQLRAQHPVRKCCRPQWAVCPNSRSISRTKLNGAEAQEIGRVFVRGCCEPKWLGC